ncbi:MAG: ATP-dependent helicase, partial [Leptolyngbya sp. SIO1D8]|nr:ATP-dependent helicase [Leptolyngbya sp. SIO1D8]
MAILHGSWLTENQRFFLWGETWQRLDPETLSAEPDLRDHPFAISSQAVLDCLKSVGGLPKSFWVDAADAVSKKRGAKAAQRLGTQILALPTAINTDSCLPKHSADDLAAEASVIALFPWRITGLLLTPREAAAFLEQLPLGNLNFAGTEIGADLRYWSHLARWGLDLMARGKYLPAIQIAPKTTQARWQLLLDSDTDTGRLRFFTQSMPLGCRTYQLVPKSRKGSLQGLSVPLKLDAEALLYDFLSVLVDTQVRAQAEPTIASSDILSPDLPVREWLQTLGSEDSTLESSAIAAARLRDALTTWTAPLQSNAQRNRFRVCFRLEPPSDSQANWQLAYLLQARDDETCLIVAETLWQYPVAEAVIDHQRVQAPQETLLAGLGRAARFCDPVRDSLQETRPSRVTLDPAQTYVFLKATVDRLRDSGFGVLLPPGLEGQGQTANRLGIQVQAAAPDRKQRQRLGLKSLLNVKWELSLAGKTVSQKDFEKLVSQETPLIEIEGQWVELRPQDIRAAREFFKRRQDPIELSVEDALRMSTGDTQVIDKLPVVSFEASGVLQDLITTLTQGNQTLKPITEPDGFQGKLRPYQARGVSWLSFLEQWGLGACLADDMGLGKTIQLIAFLLTLRQSDLLTAPVLLICPTSVLG